MDFLPHLLSGLMFVAFLVVWGSTNHYRLKSYLKLIGTSGKMRILFSLVLVAQLFVRTLPRLPESLQFKGMDFVGVVLAFLGMALAVWAKLTMKKSWGAPGQHDPQMQPELVTSGPFHFSRNPIYVGLFLFLIGFELGMESWLILAAVPVAVIINRAVMKEEKRLEEIFGEKYQENFRRVRRYL